MSSASTKIIQAAAGNAGEGLYVEEVFSTYLYDGTSATQTITNGIDLNGEGGLVWIKPRNYAENHKLVDTERGNTKEVESNTTSAESTRTNGITSFNSNGFTLGSSGSYNDASPAKTYVSWTFRKAPKFFDVVTYTGDGVAGRTVSHNLGSVPGCIIVKRTDSADGWQTYHRSLGSGYYVRLNTTAASASTSSYWNSTDPTSTVFTVGDAGGTNANGGTYVAYLFAHNDGDGEFGETGDQDIIKCGSYTGRATVDLGWEPQFILMRPATASGYNWYIYDTMRGWPVGSVGRGLYPNSSSVEDDYYNAFDITPTGFKVKEFATAFGSSSHTYIYIAIRRGPMKTPTSGTDAFAVDIRTSAEGEGKYTSGFPVDFSLANNYDAVGNTFAGTRLTNAHLQTNSTTAESSSASDYEWDYNDGISIGASGAFFGSSKNVINYMFRRAPGFFDVVAFEGDGTSTRTLNHNLGVKPEMMIIKERESGTGGWYVYHSALGATHFLSLNATHSAFSNSIIWKNTEPTESVFTTGINPSGEGVISYLFASVAGISKVGSYTGDGNATRVIDCGFSNGARFVMIRRTDDNDNWYVYDTERGIVSGNDPYLQLNESDAENTSTDFIDPNNSGFTVSNNKFNPLNHEFIFYAIA